MSAVAQQSTEQTDTLNEASVRTDLIPIFIMGKKYDVPSTLTIQKAFEYAGYQLIRGCGCRGGICGACATVYRLPETAKISVGLACQTVVQPNMYLTMIPFFPANRAIYNLDDLKPDAQTILEYYPELAKCMGCNTCTKSCPMEIPVMEYIAAALRGDIEQTAEISMSCVMCGICAARCPAELGQYNIGIMCRRITGKHIKPRAKHVREMIERINSGRYEQPLNKLINSDLQTLSKLYVDREMEPHTAPEEWTPERTDYL